MGDGSGRGFPTDCVHWATVKAAHRGGDMPEMNNILPSLSYWPADPAEPVLDISIGDALRAATSTWRTRTALIDGTSEEQTRRRWTFEELLAESEKVARALLLRFVSGEHVAIWAANGPQWVMIERNWCGVTCHDGSGCFWMLMAPSSWPPPTSG